jgi:Tfp pilus assembly protein PilX
MKLQFQPRTNQGNILMICLCLVVVLGVTLVACLELVRHQMVSVARSQTWNNSLALAEAGIEDGLAVINKYAGTLTDPATWASTATTYDGWNPAGANVFQVTRHVGSDHYSVWITNLNNQPTIKAVGTKNWNLPFGGGGNVTRAVLVKTVSSTFFQGGIISKKGITVSGNVLIDSFNSRDPNYSTGGRYDPAKHNQNGSLATTESNVVAEVFVNGTVQIYGKVFTGPGDTLKINGNVSIGSTNWVPTPGVQAGWTNNDLNVAVPPAPPPPSSGFAWPSKTSNTVNGTNYANSYLLDGKTYLNNTELKLKSSDCIIVQGSNCVYLAAGFSMVANTFIYITTNSSLTIFSGGPVDMAGQGLMNGSGYATNLTLIGTPTCTSIKYTGGSDFSGTIYAPNADFKLGGGADLIGSVVANTVDIAGGSEVHYDESLKQPPTGACYYVCYWKEVQP